MQNKSSVCFRLLQTYQLKLQPHIIYYGKETTLFFALLGRFFANKYTKKPSHTDRYFHYDSHHPKHQKLTVAKTLPTKQDLTTQTLMTSNMNSQTFFFCLSL